MTPLEMAKTVLEIHGTGLHVSEITTKAIEAGINESLPYVVLFPKITAALNASVKRKDTPFTRVKNPKDKTKYLKGQYRLKKVIQQEPFVPIKEPDTSSDTLFVGKAGEYAVMSELLFREFNVSLMSVDKGIDIVAANPAGTYFHIQVKTAQGDGTTYYSAVKRKSFDANHSGQTFYVFVLRKKLTNDFIIIPSHQIAIYAGGGVVSGQETMGFKFVLDSKTKRYTLNNKQDMSLFTNKWALIS